MASLDYPLDGLRLRLRVCNWVLPSLVAGLVTLVVVMVHQGKPWNPVPPLMTLAITVSWFVWREQLKTRVARAEARQATSAGARTV